MPLPWHQYEAEPLFGLLVAVLLTIGLSKPILSANSNLCTFKTGSPLYGTSMANAQNLSLPSSPKEITHSSISV